tara:strand:+ start:3819 stop:5324 length:1506 start_codon:yes stop_codon:yes gene_type:complete
LVSKIAHRIEEFILIVLILLGVFDFFELLPGDIEFLKKIISWTLLGYLLYKVDLTNILFGRRENIRNKEIDLFILVAYFSLIVKNLTGYAVSLCEPSKLAGKVVCVGETEIFRGAITWLVDTAPLLNTIFFYIGGILIILISLYMLRLEIKKPSLMSILHEEGLPPREVGSLILRFLSILLVLIGFFVIVFNLMLEWLAMAVEAPLLILGIFFYLFIIIRHHKRFNPETLVYKIGNFGESFYERFINLFHYKETIFLGVSAMLVLHLLTDVAIFIIPYIIGKQGALYFMQLGDGHIPLIHLMLSDLPKMVGINKLALVWTYSFNIIAMLFLLILPALIWYKLYQRKGFNVPHIALALFFCSVAVFLLMPSFRISSINKPILVGVDIQTYSILESGKALLLPFIISLVIGIAAFILSFSHWLKEKMLILGILIIDGFFGYYIYFYFKDISRYYLGSISTLILSPDFFIGLFLAMFYLVNIFLYVVGYIIFLSETKKEFRYVY